MTRLSKVWTFLSNSDNRATLAWISGVVIAIVTGFWAVYLHFSPAAPPPLAPKVDVSPPADPKAAEEYRKSQEKAYNAAACAMENVSRKISGLPPIDCPAPASSR